MPFGYRLNIVWVHQDAAADVFQHVFHTAFPLATIPRAGRHGFQAYMWESFPRDWENTQDVRLRQKGGALSVSGRNDR